MTEKDAVHDDTSRAARTDVEERAGEPVEDDSPVTTARRASRHPREVARRLAQSRKGLWSIGVMSFLETTVVPIPIEVVLIPYMLARRDILWRIATVTLIGCVLGALVGYGVGYFVFDTLGAWIVETMEWQQQFDSTQTWFENNGFWAVLAIGVTPVPFQVAMLVAGVMKYPIWLFVLATLAARGVRYYGLGLLVCWFGGRALTLWERHKKTTAVAITGVIAIAIAVNYFVLGN